MSQSVTFLKPWQLFYFHFVKRGKFMKFKQKSLGSHDVRQKGLGFLEEEQKSLVSIPLLDQKFIKGTVEKNEEKHSCKLYFYELYFYIKYHICVISNKRKGAYTRRAYIRVEKRVTNLGGCIGVSLYTGGLIYGILR